MRAHPLRVALGQVVVDGDHVHAVAGERVQIHGQGGDQRLAFAGLHFRDPALVQHHAADELHVEVPHVERAASGFADDRKGFGQNFVEDFLQHPVALGRTPAAAVLVFGLGLELHLAEAVIDAFAEFVGLGAQLRVARGAASPAREQLIRSTSGRKRLISRSFLVPNILAKIVSRNNLCPYGGTKKPARSFRKPTILDAGGRAESQGGVSG